MIRLRQRKNAVASARQVRLRQRWDDVATRLRPSGFGEVPPKFTSFHGERRRTARQVRFRESKTKSSYGGPEPL
jgi:hypothetical protein